MKKILVTGGTTFVSRYTARYFLERGDEVYVLNRNTKPQEEGVRLIEGDRHELGDKLKGLSFDVVADVTAYDAPDITSLLDALGPFGQYIMISSSAVYPDTGAQPFKEDAPLGPNRFWGAYGTGKIAAERALLSRVPDAYILRPPYLYGPMNNVYREAFVFDCAQADRAFYLPREGELKLQFFHVRDLCRLMERIILTAPAEHILNVGDPEAISVRDWVTLCYACLGKTPRFVPVHEDIQQRSYFSFYDYEYFLDVSRQQALLPALTPLPEGLQEAFAWYTGHRDQVVRKDFIPYIDAHLRPLYRGA